jgi:glycolate oxidase iron-sulfur subunit
MQTSNTSNSNFPTPDSVRLDLSESLKENATSGFDANHPPEQKLIDSCVHCGFCLSTCPSYRILGKEMDSPRGRIYLMDAINNGEAEIVEATAQHFDSCLGCLACVTTCPSGVQYDKLIAATRPQVERNYPRSISDRLIRAYAPSLFLFMSIKNWEYRSLFVQQVC